MVCSVAVSFVCFFFVHLFVCGRVCVRVLACDIERKTERKEADIHREGEIDCLC